MVEELRRELRLSQDRAKAQILQRFFKTGPGEYGEGDVFLGIQVPLLRKTAAKYDAMNLDETARLLQSEVHEERLVALLMMVRRFQKGDAGTRAEVFDLYLSNSNRVNNWDLVDLSAEHIVGAFLDEGAKDILYKLAVSQNLWERRMAIIATFRYIKAGKPEETMKIARLLLKDGHDLIQKAVGWMLREVGKRCSEADLERFLRHHYRDMSRTTLRYAIERFAKEKRKMYLKGPA